MTCEVTAFVLADGVSTCEHSQIGAKKTCTVVVDYLLKHGERFMNMSKQEFSNCLVTHILFKVSEIAKNDQVDLNDYSSTVACVLLDRRTGKFLYYSLGDSLILAVKEDCCSVIAMPSDSLNGCCVTTTNNAALAAKTGVIKDDSIISIIICSDGAWRLMYHRNHLTHDVKDALLSREHIRLKDMLMRKERFDDCSFISFDLNEFCWRKAI